MQKFIFSSSLILALIAPHFIRLAHSSAEVNPSLYIGAGVGWMSGQTPLKKNLLFGQKSQSKGNIGKEGMRCDVRLGYEYPFSNKFSVSLEALAALSSFKIQHNETANLFFSTFRYTSKTSYGIAIKPAYVIHENGSAAYIKLGYLNTTWKAVINMSTAGTAPIKYSKCLNGFEMGLGLAIPFTNHASTGIEYTRTLYQKQTFQYQNLAIYSTKPIVNTITVFLKYKF